MPCNWGSQLAGPTTCKNQFGWTMAHAGSEQSQDRGREAGSLHDEQRRIPAAWDTRLAGLDWLQCALAALASLGCLSTRHSTSNHEDAPSHSSGPPSDRLERSRQAGLPACIPWCHRVSASGAQFPARLHTSLPSCCRQRIIGGRPSCLRACKSPTSPDLQRLNLSRSLTAMLSLTRTKPLTRPPS